MSKVLVLVGAGASKDCANASARKANEWTPPLANELFNIESRGHFEQILQSYPGAKFLAAELAEYALHGSVSLEDKLRELNDHKCERIRGHFKDIPRYLAALLAHVSKNFTNNPGNYVRLIKHLVSDSGHKVGMVVLNYDTLLETAIGLYEPSYKYSDIHDYVEPSRDVLVYKVHGSVNWRTNLAFRTEVTFTDQDRKVYFMPNRPWKITVDDGDFYRREQVTPVLTAPLAGKTQEHLVCPPEHVSSLINFMRGCEKILFLGTSGLDGNILELISREMSNIRSCHIVCYKDGKEVAHNIQVVFGNLPKTTAIFDGGFRAYLNDPLFQDFLQC